MIRSSFAAAFAVGLAAVFGAATVAAPAAAQSTKTKKPVTKKKTSTKKKITKKVTKSKSRPTKPGTLFLTFYNAKWSQAKAGKCGESYKLLSATQKKRASARSKKLYVTQIKLCGTGYWITKRAATCRRAHARARHKEVVRRFVSKGKYSASCPRGAQASIDKAAAARKKKFRKNIKRKKPAKSTKKKSS